MHLLVLPQCNERLEVYVQICASLYFFVVSKSEICTGESRRVQVARDALKEAVTE